jgi:predicted nucleic acid-binding protein
MRRIYLDSAPIIYLVEHVAPYEQQILALLQSTDALVTSELARLECRVKPIRGNDMDTLHDYDVFFQSAFAKIVSLSSEVVDLATDIRASYNFSVADSIHLASALLAQCDLFVTSDLQIARYNQITVVVLSSLNSA